MIPLTVVADDAALAAEAARLLTHELLKPMLPEERRGILLAGGSTPLAAYRLTAAQNLVAGPGQVFFLSDERHVAPDSPQNNFRNLQPLFDAVGCPPERCLRVPTLLPAEDAASAYEEMLASFLAGAGRIPLGFLGLGADGHTASLFSAEDVARGAGRLAVAVQRPDGIAGISVTPDLLRRVDRLVFLVSGSGKREMARRLIDAPDSLTAGRAVRGCPRVELWADRAAWPEG
jgi:6-phosphogluconolactonase